MKITNWGKYPEIEAKVESPSNETEAMKVVLNATHTIARGLGRCYGDSSLCEHITSSRKLNCLLAFDQDHGILECEAGVSFDEILKTFVPRGWFLPVTPGTKFITVGGAIASDIHGKNHHSAGSFSDHVSSFDLLLAEGKVVHCSRESNPELFFLTCGGMGLTGIILRATFRLENIESAYIRQESVKARNLDEIMKLFEDSSDWSKTVAWIDCLSSGKNLGRSIMMRGEVASLAELKTSRQKCDPLAIHKDGKLNIPFNFPSFALNKLSVRAFNFLFFHQHPNKKVERIIHYDSFYYPLDAIHNWNRIYGKNGFTQYQFVLPLDKSREGLIEIIGHIGKKKMGSFLTVLKLFGPQKENYLRFPMEGYTLAMDFKLDDKVWDFMNEMDELVLKYGGRIYLTKDVRMNNQVLTEAYPQAKEFITRLRDIDPEGRFSSLQSRRMQITNT